MTGAMTATAATTAARTASSDSRRTVRARIRFATFEQAMTKMSSAAANRMIITVRALDVSCSRSITMPTPNRARAG